MLPLVAMDPEVDATAMVCIPEDDADVVRAGEAADGSTAVVAGNDPLPEPPPHAARVPERNAKSARRVKSILLTLSFLGRRSGSD